MEKFQMSLDDWAVEAFRVFRPLSSDHRYVSQSVAFTTGRHARRCGLTEDGIRAWLQDNYGRIFVRENQLNPGADSKEILDWMIQAYRSKT